jgi:molecular chaperone DnaK (HSP70)
MLASTEEERVGVNYLQFSNDNAFYKPRFETNRLLQKHNTRHTGAMASAASDLALNAATAEKLAAVIKAADFEGANPAALVSGPRIVLGIDIGTAKMTVSKVDLSAESDSLNASVVTSDTGMKSIPPLVGFRGVARKIGEPAGLEERSNAKNTFTDLAFYIGKTKEALGLANDCVSLFRQFEIEEDTDEITFVVAASGNNPAMPLTGSQVAAMLLHAVSKFLSEEESKNIVGITCCHPNSYTQTQIDSLCDAIRILKIQVLPPVASTTAIEVEFSQKHADKISLSATEQPYNVLFIDVGHTATNTLIMQYSQASGVGSPDEEAKKASDLDNARDISKALKGTVKHQGGDATLGARNVDFFMFEDILAVLKEKHQGMAPIKPNSKYGSRIRVDCKKTKEILSTISETAIILENLPGGMDARIPFSQQKL